MEERLQHLPKLVGAQVKTVMMFDLETLGVDSKSAILQVGWVIKSGSKELASAEYDVRHSGPILCQLSTLQFWLQRPADFQAQIERCLSNNALEELYVINKLVQASDRCDEVWSNGAFDLMFVTRVIGYDPFFRKWNDFRTFRSLYHEQVERVTKGRNTHSALADARNQMQVLEDVRQMAGRNQ
jgi:hypothetical protein